MATITHVSELLHLLFDANFYLSVVCYKNESKVMAKASREKQFSGKLVYATLALY